MCTCNSFAGTISNGIVKLSSPNTLREQFTLKQYRYITITKGDKPCMRTQSCTWYVWPLEEARFLYNALTRHKKKMKQHRQQSDGEELLMYLLLGSERASSSNISHFPSNTQLLDVKTQFTFFFLNIHWSNVNVVWHRRRFADNTVLLGKQLMLELLTVQTQAINA